jgi:hypothetical protein
MQKLYAKKKISETTMNNSGPAYTLILRRPQEHSKNIYSQSEHKVEAILRAKNKEVPFCDTITVTESAKHKNKIDWQPDDLKTWLKHKVNPSEILDKYEGGDHIKVDNRGRLYIEAYDTNEADNCTNCGTKLSSDDKLYVQKTTEGLSPDFLCKNCKIKKQTATQL